VIGPSISTEGMIVDEVLMSSSSFPSYIDIVLDAISSSSPKYGRKSEMLKLGLTPNSGGNPSLYALSLILARILKGPAARDISLDFLNSRNHSFLKCSHTKSPGSSFTFLRPLLAAM
jgi:hypothetical protein